jgi:hypothetical protein
MTGCTFHVLLPHCSVDDTHVNSPTCLVSGAEDSTDPGVFHTM